MPSNASILQYIPKSAISVMNQAAIEHDAINLASGYPDFDPPPELLAAAEQAIRSGRHQYANTWGSRTLRQAIAEKCSRWMDLPIDAQAHVTVTIGGTEAVLVSLMSLCNPGERVVIFSPYYETYPVNTRFCHAEPLFVPLRPPDFNFDPSELRRACQQNAKALVLCNPSNPCGKVFTPQELATIAELAIEFDLVVIADEVYEHLAYPPHVHTYIASLPGMFERTISCSSLSKTYAITGWRLGYAIADAPLSHGLRRIHDYTTLAAPTPLQHAAVSALRFPDAYYHDLQNLYDAKRQLFLDYLERAGLNYIPPQGGYFVMVDISPFGIADDYQFCHWMAKEIGVAGVPGSSFFHEPVNHLVRLNFAKRDETLHAAGERLLKLRDYAG